MTEKKKLLKQGIGYSVGNILINAITFFSIPLFTRLMTVEGYGEYNVYLSYSNIFFVFVGFALHSTLTTAKYDFRERYEDYISTCVKFIILSFMVYSSYIVVSGILHIRFLGYSALLLECIMIRSFYLSLANFYSNEMIMDYKYKEQILANLAYNCVDIVLGVIFVAFFFLRSDFGSRVSANTAASVILIIFMGRRMLRRGSKFNFDYLKYGLKISLPVVPHGISQIILSSFDRIMIKDMVGSLEAGVYSLTFTIGSVLSIIVNSIVGIWNPWFYENMDQHNNGMIFRKSRWFAVIITLIAVNVILVSPEGIMILAPESYWSSKTVAPVVLLGIYFSLLYFFPASVEYYHKKTKFLALGTILAAVINIGLNYIFIPRYGHFAAAYTTVFTYFLYFAFHMSIYEYIEREKILDTRVFSELIIASVVVGFLSVYFIEYLYIRWLICFIIDAISFIIIWKKLKNSKLKLG